MKKNVVRIGIALLVLVLGLGTYKLYTDSQKEQGSKAIQIVIQDDQKTILFDKTVRTDVETLGDLLDEMISNQLFEITFEGNKSDLYGRFIVQINDVKANAAGPWWVYESANNTECVAAGYCGGIDMNPIHDADEFIFKLSMGY